MNDVVARLRAHSAPTTQLAADLSESQAALIESQAAQIAKLNAMYGRMVNEAHDTMVAKDRELAAMRAALEKIVKEIETHEFNGVYTLMIARDALA